MQCPAPEEILAAAEERAQASTSLPPELAAHVRACDACRASLSRAETLVQLLSEAREAALPDALPKPDLPVPTVSSRTQVAELVPRADLGEVIAVRGGLPTAHNLYRTANFDIDVSHLPSGALAGQILGTHEDPANARGYCLLSGSGGSRMCPLSPTGEFFFESVPQGVHTLVVKFADRSVVVPSLDLGQR